MPEPPAECEGRGWLLSMKICVIAHHLGGVQPEEPVMAGYARALGFENPNELQREPGASENIPRHEAAMARLFAQHGVDMAATSWEQQADTFDTLLATLPDWLMARVGLPPGVTFVDAHL